MLNKIKENLQKVLKQIDDNFENYVEPPPSKLEGYEFEEIVDDSNPYEDASWGAAENWHCIRCGFPLRNIDEKDSAHGSACYSDMRRDGTLHYQCSNKDCFHYSAPLILHHPIRGCKSPAGDSYSISWVK